MTESFENANPLFLDALDGNFVGHGLGGLETIDVECQAYWS